jgi:hypothetical protein
VKNGFYTEGSLFSLIWLNEFSHYSQPKQIVIASAAKQSAKVSAVSKFGFGFFNKTILNLNNPLLKLGQIASLRSQ